MSSAGEQVVFEQTMEGLLRAAGPRLDPGARRRLRDAGLDVDRKLLPAYRFEVWMTCLEIAAHALWPDEPKELALFKLGECFIDGYGQTLLGRAVLGVIRVIGPRRTLLRATRNFRSGNNYTESKLVDVGDTCVELWMNEVGPWPSFTQGLITAALRASGVTPDVVLVAHDGHAATYRCSWR